MPRQVIIDGTRFVPEERVDPREKVLRRPDGFEKIITYGEPYTVFHHRGAPDPYLRHLDMDSPWFRADLHEAGRAQAVTTEVKMSEFRFMGRFDSKGRPVYEQV